MKIQVGDELGQSRGCLVKDSLHLFGMPQEVIEKEKVCECVCVCV